MTEEISRATSAVVTIAPMIPPVHDERLVQTIMVRAVEERESAGHDVELSAIQERVSELAQAHRELSEQMGEVREALAILISQKATLSTAMPVQQLEEEALGAARNVVEVRQQSHTEQTNAHMLGSDSMIPYELLGNISFTLRNLAVEVRMIKQSVLETRSQAEKSRHKMRKRTQVDVRKNPRNRKRPNPGHEAETSVMKTRDKGKEPQKSRHMTISERDEKNGPYTFDIKDLVPIMERLIEERKLRLPKSIRPAEVGRVDDPNYCEYHRCIGHKTEQCFVLKGKIQKMINQGVVSLKMEGSDGTPASTVPIDIT